jgi:hypothetical protein
VMKQIDRVKTLSTARKRIRRNTPAKGRLYIAL